MLTAADIDDLYALARTAAGIDDAQKRAPRELDDAQVASPANSSRLVQLLAIKELANVINAQAVGGSLPISESGLTVIYGENGAGKSGYSRILKHACRTRDQRESILADSKVDPAKAGKQSASFEVAVDGAKTDLAWTFGKPPPEALSVIAIFDTHCARAYIDNYGDFAYRPYGLDILEGLVGLCGKLKAMATQEKAANAPSSAAYAAIATDKTGAGKALLAIPGATKASSIDALATFTDADHERLALLTKTLTEADPKQKAQAFRRRVGRLQELKGRIDQAIPLINDAKLKALRGLIEQSKLAKSAADVAATDFKAVPGQLMGTGGEEWKALFEAARTFAAISHPEPPLGSLPGDADCPLCQNPLGL